MSDVELILDEVIEMDVEDTIVMGGSGGTSDYNMLTNKPKINGTELNGDKSLEDLGITDAIGDEVEDYVEEHKEELKGEKGEKGDSVKGDKGDDGFSPSAKVERTVDGAKITITDKDGTTEAVVKDGKGGEGGNAEWGAIGGTLSEQTDLKEALDGKQSNLVSGENIKTINGTSILGEGNLIIQGGSGVDVLANKKIAFVGDSITYGTGSTSANTECDGYFDIYNHKQSFPEVLKELHPNALIYNYGRAGLPIGENTSGSNLIAVLNTLISRVNDVDYLVLSGGVNDAWVSGTSLGSLSSDFNGNYDKTTFYGALEQYIYNAIHAYPNAYIMFLMTHNNISKNYGSGNTDMNGVIREVCKKWKVKLLDLQKNIGVNLSIYPYKEMYMADTTHPNEQCYRKYYAPLCSEALLDYGIDTSNGQIPPTPPTEKTLVSISATKTKTTYNVDDSINIDDISVSAIYSDGTSATVSGWTTNASSIDMSTDGTKTLTVTYTENEVTKTSDITITVEAQPQPEEWDGEAYISAAWQSYTTTEKYSQPNAKCVFSGTLLSDKTITNLEIKLVSAIVSVNLTANVPYELNAEFTPTMAYTGNLVFTAKGSGYPAHIKYKNIKFTRV